jgi:hypothetical protein
MPDWMNVKKSKTAPSKIKQSIPAADVQLIDTKSFVQNNTWQDILRGVEEGRRNDAATRIVGKLLHHVPLKDSDSFVLPMLEAWNQLNKPPMSDSEVYSIYKSLEQKHANKNVTQSPARPERKLLTVSEILKLPDEEKPDFLVNALVPESGITALSGHPGCGKSWIMLHMAHCVATGTRFLDQLATKKGNVLIVDEESGKWEMKRRMQLLGYPDDVPVYFYCQDGFKIDKKEDLDKLLRTVVDNDIKLVVIDPFVAIHSKIENSAEEAQAIMECLQRFNGVGAAVLMVHHHRKGGIGGGGLSLRGSSTFSGRLDSHITVTKSEGLDPIYLNIEHEKSRRGRNFPEFRVALTEDGQNNSIQLVYEAGVDAPVIKKDRAKELILEVLKTGEGSTDDIIDTIRNEEEIGVRNIRDALKGLEDAGQALSRREGKMKMYSLNPEMPSDVVAEGSPGTE